jgi:hypothetical protein
MRARVELIGAVRERNEYNNGSLITTDSSVWQPQAGVVVPA